MNELFKYDVFISHSRQDTAAARALAERLQRDGLSVWPEVLADHTPSQIEAALEQARTLVLLLSRQATAAEWVTFEQHAVRFRDPLNQLRCLIPVRLDDAEMQDALKHFAYVDWRLRSEEQYARLLAACRPADDETERVAEPKGQAQPSRVFRGHEDNVMCVAVTPDGKRILSGSTG